MKNEQNYDIEMSEVQDDSRLGKIGAIVRLLFMAATFVLCMALFVSDLTKGRISAVGDLFGAFALPAVIWMYVKACCLAKPIVKAVWEWVIPLTVLALIVKIMVCIGIFGLPGMFYVEYVMNPILNVLGGDSTFLAILVLTVLALCTALFVWMDLCKLRGRSFLRRRAL